jgi:regulator of sigma E protease
MQVGEKVLRVNQTPVKDWIHWVDLIRANPEKELQVDILRRNKTITMTIIPALVEEGEQKVGKIGAGLDQSFLQDKSNQAIESYTPVPALYKAVQKTADMSMMTLRILGKMIVGEASVKNLSGPISIAQYAGKTAGLGLAVFLGFMAVISVSLGVLNLLPIPLLDGGHLLYYLIELVKGSPPSEAFQIAGQQFGLIVLLGLMSIALYNDILRVVG